MNQQEEFSEFIEAGENKKEINFRGHFPGTGTENNEYIYGNSNDVNMEQEQTSGDSSQPVNFDYNNVDQESGGGGGLYNPEDHSSSMEQFGTTESNDRRPGEPIGEESNTNDRLPSEPTGEESLGKRKLDSYSSADETSRTVENGDTEIPSKKPALEINIRKLLPDLEKHWKPVEDDPTDFNSWTFLLQYVDQENELLAAREAYDGFLGRYSYCYGYWKKYADFEKRNGSAFDCEQVFRRGLKAIPLSVDLWIHYLNYVKATHEKDIDYVRGKFEESIASCGLEFRSDKLWEHYIHWEKEVNNLKNVLALYDKVIATPTQSHLTHFQNLKTFVEQNAPEDILSEKELESLKASLEPAVEPPAEEGAESTEVPPPNVANTLREKLLESRAEIYRKNEEQIRMRWTFEEAIKRPYFHVKPLEKGQLKMWKEYLDFEIEKGDLKRIHILFERCLIACALYEEYWMKYITYLQAQPDKNVQLIREVFIRACTIYHPNKLWINLYWCAFEESQGNFEKVNELFDKLEKNIPDSLHVFYKRIHFERRNGNLPRCQELFEKYIESTKGKIISTSLTIKYAYFLHYSMQDMDKAKELLQNIETEDEQLQATVLMALIDLGFRQRDAGLISSTFQRILNSNVSKEIKINFAHRNIEFLEETATDVASILKAHEQLQLIAKSLREKDVEATPATAGTNDIKAVKPESVPYQQTAARGSVPAGGPYNGASYNQYGPTYPSWDSTQSQPPPNYSAPTNGASTYYNNQQQPSWGSYQNQGYYG